MIAVAVIGALGTAGGAWLSQRDSSEQATPGNAPTEEKPIEVEYPEPGDEVTSPTDITGEILTPIDSDHRLWVYSRKEGERNYHPQVEYCPVRQNAFECPPTYLGQDGEQGTTYTLFLALVDDNAITEIQRYNQTASARNYPGLRGLPAGTEVIATRTVTLVLDG